MEQARKLQKADWIKAGLKALGTRGSAALKADILARQLGVSRGSFYWHFADVAAFHRAVLAAWEEAAVDRPYASAMVKSSDDLTTNLRALVDRAFTSPVELELAVLSWGKTFAEAAVAAERVNARRFELLSSMFTRQGQDSKAARMRAYLLLSAYLGRMHLGAVHSLDDAERGDLVALLTNGAQEAGR
ncbi:MAG: TetR/AcrR family transcriptional regulator [Erythrobacter sp.]